MRIRRLLEDRGHSELETVRPQYTLVKTAQILHDRKIGALPVVDDAESMVGIVSERDLVRSLANDGEKILEKVVSDVMTSSVITCEEDDDAASVYRQMTDRRIRHMPVVRGTALVGMLSIRDFEAAYRYLLEHSVTDDMTGMANARSFARQLDAEFNRFRRYRFPLSVVAIRIGDYQPFVARNGNPAGESMLQELAESLDGATRSFDMIAHISDVEFGIILPNTEPKAARRACDRLLNAAQTFFKRETAMADLSIGIGAASADDDTRDANSILEHARTLAKKAAAMGRNHIETGNAGQQTDAASGLVAAE